MIIIDIIKWNLKQLQGLLLLASKVKKFIKFYGGSRSGKTYLVIRSIRIRAIKYPGSKHLVARFSFASAKRTIWLQTMLPEFRKDEKLGLCKIIKDEGQVHYKNGSIVLLGGLEPSRIDNILAAEYGTIFITEANENRYDVVENLFSRLNDTSTDLKGNPIKLKFIIDLNPTVETSWTNVLFIKGLDPISKTPKANFHEYASLWFSPYDNKENLSKGYIETLENLSKSKRRRYLEGKYSSYEGLVFPVDEDVHIVDDFEIPADWKRIRAIDFGYTHPFVCLWFAYDKANDRAFVYREWIHTRWTVRSHSDAIKELSIEDIPEDLQSSKEAWRFAEKKYSATVCDHDAEDRATLEENGIGPVKPANKEVLAGIDNVIDLMEISEHKKPRVYIFRSLAGLRESLDSYRWRDTTMSNRGRAKDREVLKEDDDPADAFRYGLCELFPIVKPIDLGGRSLNLGSSWKKK